MMRRRARALSTMGKQLFWSAAGLGALCGAAAAVAILGPAAYWTGSQGDVDTAYLLKFLATILPIAMLSGIGVGILSWAATYAAVGILEVRRPEATALHQAAAGAAGSMAGGLLSRARDFSKCFGGRAEFWNHLRPGVRSDGIVLHPGVRNPVGLEPHCCSATARDLTEQAAE